MDLKERAEYAAEAEGISIINYPLKISKSAILDDSGYLIIMDKKRIESNEEETALLWHELGHYFTGTLYRVDSSLETKKRCEYRSNAWIVKSLCPVSKLKKAMASGASQMWEIASELTLPEELVKQAIYLYQCKGML